jgi:hypothetical protein
MSADMVKWEEDPFAHLRNSSWLHAAIINPDGALILTPCLSGDEQSLTDFQSVALKALEIAAKEQSPRHGATCSGATGRRLYDKIVIYPQYRT